MIMRYIAKHAGTADAAAAIVACAGHGATS